MLASHDNAVSEAVAFALATKASPSTVQPRPGAAGAADGVAAADAAGCHEPERALVQVYGKAEYVEWVAQVAQVADESNSRLRQFARRLPPGPLVRPLAAPPEARVFDDLIRRFPNHVAALESLRDQAALCRLTAQGMRTQPLLLLGGAGNGKTMLARAVAEALGVPMYLVGMAHCTAGFMLGGLDAGWSTGRPGLPFQLLVLGRCANPVIVLDELDKASTDERHSPLGALYSLLEPSTARHFSDEMISLPIDARSIIWIATANTLDSIPAPLLSRFEVVRIPGPTQEQMPAVLASIWTELRATEPWWGADFEAELPPSTVAALSAAASPRDAAQRLRRAAARAAIRGRREVLPEDLPATAPVADDPRRPIGFLCPVPRSHAAG